MKKLAYLFLAACVALAIAACADGDVLNQPVVEVPAPVETEPPVAQFKGKIAIISNSNTGADEDYNAAQMVIEKYGTDKVVHVTWPANFMVEQEQMIKIITTLGADPEIKAIIVNQAVPGTAEAFNKLQETRDDIFAIFIEPQGYIEYMAQRADILLATDEIGMGPAMVRQAQKLGAKTFVHYSFPRHMSQILLGNRRDLIREACAGLGLEFVDATIPDPTSDIGVSGTKQFLLDDVPKMVAKYGVDTAFFVTYCSIQASLIEAVIETGTIYLQPCHPSPYHGFPQALGIETHGIGTAATAYTIAETTRILGEMGASGRLSTWPDLPSSLLTAASVEYAIKWINGEVPKKGIDVDVLKRLMEDYAGVEVYLTPFVDDGLTDFSNSSGEPTGETYDNFLLMRMDYITY